MEWKLVSTIITSSKYTCWHTRGGELVVERAAHTHTWERMQCALRLYRFSWTLFAGGILWPIDWHALAHSLCCLVPPPATHGLRQIAVVAKVHGSVRKTCFHPLLHVGIHGVFQPTKQINKNDENVNASSRFFFFSNRLPCKYCVLHVAIFKCQHTKIHGDCGCGWHTIITIFWLYTRSDGRQCPIYICILLDFRRKMRIIFDCLRSFCLLICPL